MKKRQRSNRRLGAALILSSLVCSASIVAAANARHPAGPDIVPDWKPLMEFPDAGGRVGVAYDGPEFKPSSNAFFKPGPNGRSCASCHRPQDAMSLSFTTIQSTWKKTQGKDPLFAAMDGSNCPSLPQDKPESHSLLLERGLVRIPLRWPPKNNPDPDIKIEVVSDPTGCNLDPVYGIHAAKPYVSVFRRPRMVANLRWVETPKYDINFKNMLVVTRDPETKTRAGLSMMADARALSLRGQAIEADEYHLAITGPRSATELEQIAQFEHHVYVAQNYSDRAGPLHGAGEP